MNCFKFITVLFLFFFYSISYAQLQSQLYASNKESELLGIFDKDFSSNTKWNYFISATLAYNYDSKDLGAELYNNLNYKLIDNWGVSLGANITKDAVTPLLGVAYTKEYKDFGINFFPAINYSFDAEEIGYGFYSLMEYTPKINDKFNFYSMLILESDFSDGKHEASNQILRLGLLTSKKLQFGIGSNISQFGDNFEYDANFGVFIGKQF